ncbi:TetR/AcrR family transcriptional regulator [Dactylosporangium sp. AC04546]|uniref:TetR/AcrR family transcriptional regulator n=1 Tax=Dactylosporangium sp. AC04546 TaxID=2862460 RepID=UPI001EDECC77|nr:TetR/AcrR family transcriptional regulator [Dactylosporangium sp. AC04546]WVK85998.1 TetR/AcrR family transcriptional regulator [Dactylosporangium sp. AC04546]
MPKRQARGEQRMAEILDAAGRVFAASGYERATTNAIAAEAGVSPGSLYQFFANKEAIAAALAERFVAQMREAHEAALLGADPSTLDWPELIDRTVEPILAFNVANPGFKALFARPDMPAGLAAAAEPIQAALLGRVESVIAAKAPSLPAEVRTRTARVAIQIFQAMLPMVLGSPPEERPAVMAELKKVLYRYLSALSP